MGKKYKAASEKIDSEELHDARKAVELVKDNAFAKFDETIDAVFLLGIDPKQADQAVRGTVSLPHGTGKDVRVVAIAEGDKAKDAEAAGAALVGGKELIKELEGGRALDFDVVVATPDMMSEVGKLGRVLGPRGLMPNPKSGTVTQDIGKAVSEFKAGRVEYRNDRFGNVQVPIGKASFDAEKLERNLVAITDEVIRAKPAAAKGRYLLKLVLSSTMGPGVKIDPAAADALAKEAH